MRYLHERERERESEKKLDSEKVGEKESTIERGDFEIIRNRIIRFCSVFVCFSQNFYFRVLSTTIVYTRF